MLRRGVRRGRFMMLLLMRNKLWMGSKIPDTMESGGSYNTFFQVMDSIAMQ
jgi:hypothetical protein